MEGTQGGRPSRRAVARSPPRPHALEVQGGGSAVPFVGCGFGGVDPPLARLKNPERVGARPTLACRGGPRSLLILGEVLVTMHQTPANLSGFVPLTIARRGTVLLPLLV